MRESNEREKERELVVLGAKKGLALLRMKASDKSFGDLVAGAGGKGGINPDLLRSASLAVAILGVINPQRLVGWLSENGSVALLCYLRHKLVPAPERITFDDPKESYVTKLKKFLKNFLKCMASNLFAEQGAVYLLYFVSNTVFRHVKPFRVNKGRADPPPFTLAAYQDWLKGNGQLQIIGGGFLLAIMESFQPEWTYKELEETPFSPVQFLKNMAVFRVIVDVVFYVGHRAMHENQWLYRMIHRRHHSHYHTSIVTNFHFSAPDLFIESAAPVFAAFLTLRGLLGVKMSRFEMHTFLTYAAWHESGTHVGKPIPVISMFPPLSIFYNSIVDVDKHTILAHERHHNIRDYNHGITPWIDYLCGTLKLD